MSLSVSEVLLGERRLFTGIIHDLSGRRQLEREIIEASTDEQRRIGQDLHDGLCQDLIGIAFQTDFAARQLATRSDPQAEGVEKLAVSIRSAAGQARRLSHGLNPVDLKAGGLPVALQALALKVSDSFNVSCKFRGEEEVPIQNDLTATHLYRIVQEAVSNAIKHGKARNIQIQLIVSPGKLILSIKDDGVGLPASMLQGTTTAPKTGAAGASTTASGIGLHTMHYRCNMIGGNFSIRPGRARGTIVACTIRGELPRPRTPIKKRARILA